MKLVCSQHTIKTPFIFFTFKVIMIKDVNTLEGIIYMKEPITKDVLEGLNKAIKEGKAIEYLDKTVSNIPEGNLSSFFNGYLAEHPEKSLPEIVKDSCLDRNYAYQIIDGKKNKVGRDRIIALCFAARMNLNDTNRALRFSNNQELYIKNNRDGAIMVAINLMNSKNPDYQTVMQLNNFLIKRGEEELNI